MVLPKVYLDSREGIVLVDIPNWSFCDDLEGPEFCVILSPSWWQQNRHSILAQPGISETADRVLYIPDANTRLLFQLKWA
jgi:hypothetical protein